MDKCSKFKVFNLLMLFCAANFVLYRYFSRPDTPLVTKLRFDENKEMYLNLLMAANNDTINIPSTNSKAQQEIRRHNINDVSNESASPLNSTGMVVIKPVQEIDFRRSGSSSETSSASNPLSPPDTKSPSQTGTAVYPMSDGWSYDGNVSVKASGNYALFSQTTGMALCPVVPPRLNGPLGTYLEPSSWEEIAKENPGLKPGGRYKPPDCQARHRVAIIIPYRNREEHLKILLKNLHPILARQQLDYGVFVIDQALPGRFNRAMLMNIGYKEAMKRYNYQCAVFHDVDLVPENDRNIYSCPEMPRHMSAAIDKFNYRLPYTGIYGGVSAVNREQFEKINGFSNMFFGWGGEDDDMAKRIAHAGYKITRYPMEVARYKMVRHINDAGNEKNPLRFALLKTTKQRMATDGLNSLVYNVQVVQELPTHLRIQVLINEDDILKGRLSLS